MYSAVRGWIAQPPVSQAVIDRQRERWVQGQPALSIAHALGLGTVNELYQLRHFLQWPSRHTYPSTKPRVPVTWTEAELAKGREQWIALEPAKVIQKTLHLSTRRRVYLIAEREGWPPRYIQKQHNQHTHPKTPKEEWPSVQLKQAAQDVARGVAPPPEDQFEAARRAFRLDDLPTDHLHRICPSCDGRVTPEFGVRVQEPAGEELYHERCLPPAARAAA